jgi:hypothetical protein
MHNLTEFIHEKALIAMRKWWNIYFSSLYLKDNCPPHGVGIFRVQPGILDVGLVENTRELGEL